MKNQRTRTLAIDSLERREVMSAGIFESEPNDTKGQADVAQLDLADRSAIDRVAHGSRFLSLTLPGDGKNPDPDRRQRHAGGKGFERRPLGQ